MLNFTRSIDSKEKCYIFFDCDGVINKESEWNRLFSIDSGCAKDLGELFKTFPNAVPVMCSTWRMGIDTKAKTYTPEINKALSKTRKESLIL